MHDTIILNFPFEQFVIEDRERFSPSARGFIGFPPIYMGNQKMIKATNNPTKAEKETSYYPTMTLFKSLRRGGYKVYLHVQFSAQKMLRGNNFDETGDDELDQLCQTLHERLRTMGVLIKPSVIRKANVTAIHYAKNIPLTDYTIPFDYIHKLGQIDQSLWLDTAKVIYKNGGNSFKLHANTWELTIYDKRKDLQAAKRSERKADSKDNKLQLNIFEAVNEKLFFEVIRIELRLNTAKAIRQHLERAGVPADYVPELTLEQLFDDFIATSLLIFWIRKLEASYPKVHKHSYANSLDLLVDLRINNPQVRLETLLAGVTYSQLLDALTDVREIRTALGPKAAKQWSTLKNRLGNLSTSDAEKAVFNLLTDSIIKGDKLSMKDYYPPDKNQDQASERTK